MTFILEIAILTDVAGGISVSKTSESLHSLNPTHKDTSICDPDPTIILLNFCPWSHIEVSVRTSR